MDIVVHMPKRSSRRDFVQNALRVVEIATGAPLTSKKNPAAVALGKLGGRVGGRTVNFLGSSPEF
jgi:hypothetical protein